ncbi:hypothetical protein EHS25_003370 [Saitozyma podzolica]|uniref:Ser-Thr-rich glycosyl-phosphatidyl-inositol-anchored membrane family-domain-containing protein n=1 Tax=Saitozyma podzolica TaxID=1890683 RepID=A0A427Y8K7_9TREE|nr:hypothetical protein EHS25_003370 [Saitozyma podzolica]
MRNVALVILAAATAVMAQLQIFTPASLVQCQPVLVSWQGGTSPYFVSIIPGGQTTAAAIKNFGQTSATSLTWTVDIPAGQSITFKIVDSTGNINYGSPLTIQSGSSGCLSPNSTISDFTVQSGAQTQAASGASGSANAAVSTTSIASAASSLASSAKSAAASATSSAAASATSSHSAARQLDIPAQGGLALLGAAILRLVLA